MQDIVNLPQPIEPSPGCVAGALAVLGNKWTALIILNLCDGTLRFSQIQNALPTISPRTLSQRLDELEADNIITKRVYAEVPPKVEYSLTAKGQDLIPILRSMADWGDKYPFANCPSVS